MCRFRYASRSGLTRRRYRERWGVRDEGTIFIPRVHILTSKRETIETNVAKLEEQVLRFAAELTRLRAENHLMRAWIEAHGGDVEAVVTCADS